MSVGSPNRGWLVRGAHLESDANLLVKPSSVPNSYGTDELVGLLHRIADRIAAEAPGLRLHVGDLSADGGGRHRPHRSHRTGRDADVGFYLSGEDGRPHLGPRFLDIDREGVARADPSVRLDEEHTWRVVELLVTELDVPVQTIFVAPHVRARLLDAGRRLGASDETLARAEAVLTPERAHTNHMHVRIYCPIGDVPRCDETPPYHAWVDRSAARAAIAEAARAHRSVVAREERAARARRGRARRDEPRSRTARRAAPSPRAAGAL